MAFISLTYPVTPLSILALLMYYFMLIDPLGEFLRRENFSSNGPFKLLHFWEADHVFGNSIGMNSIFVQYPMVGGQWTGPGDSPAISLFCMSIFSTIFRRDFDEKFSRPVFRLKLDHFGTPKARFRKFHWFESLTRDTFCDKSTVEWIRRFFCAPVYFASCFKQ